MIEPACGSASGQDRGKLEPDESEERAEVGTE
jgi:hypothetical protein